MTETAAPPAISDRKTATVQLANPIEREGGNVESLTLRKPRAGELRGLSLQALLQSDVDQLVKLLPRITEPALIDREIAALEAEDIAEIGGTVFGFFMNPATRRAIEEMTAN